VKQHRRWQRYAVAGAAGVTLIAIAAFVATSVAAIERDRPTELVAILGQSNAWGAGLPMDSSDVADEQIQQFVGSGEYQQTVQAAYDPLIGHSPAIGVGPGIQFAEELHTATGNPVLLVPASEGSTGFAPHNGMSWDPANTTDENLFDYAVSQINAALALDGNYRLSAIIWVQGENDTTRMDAPSYSDAFDRLLDGLRAEFDDTPVIVGSMTPDWIAEDPGTRAVIDDVHRAAATRYENVTYVEGPAGMHNPGETIHYSAAGQAEQGRRMFNAYATLTELR